MKLQLKKITLSKIITLLFYCNIYAMMPPVPEVWIDPRMDTSPYNFTIDTPTEKITSHTINHEDRIIAIQERCDRETGEIKQHVDVQIYPEIYFRNESGQQFDLPSNLNFNNQNNSNSDTTHSSNIQQEHDYFTNKFKDDALESHRQEIESNNAPQAHTQQSDIRAIQREKALQELHKIHTSSASPKNIFSLPIVQTHLKQFKYNIAAKYENKHVISFRKKTPPPIAKAELKFADALISIKVGDYLTQIKYADSITATTAFAELKELWIWKRGHTFLTSGHQNGTGETGFIARLGIDIMQIAERNLISRPDYIAEHTDAQSFKTIQEYREKCIALQQKGDRNALFQEELRLRHELF